MKRYLTLFVLLLLTGMAYSQTRQESDYRYLPSERHDRKENPKKAHKGWRLVWSDEFSDGKTDTESWNRCPESTPDWARHMSSHDELCQEKDGVLQLHAVNRPKDSDDKRPYLTGGVQSKGKRSIQKGRIDIRARFDCAQGFWPAIWLMPDAAVPWPSGGEIDIMEHLNHENRVFQTVHSRHTLEKRQPQSQSSFITEIDPHAFNVYSVAINEDSIEFYLNGTLTGTYHRMNPEAEDQFPYPDYPYYVILSAQLGGEWVGHIEPEELPVRMDIDYVRFYSRK